MPGTQARGSLTVRSKAHAATTRPPVRGTWPGGRRTSGTNLRSSSPIAPSKAYGARTSKAQPTKGSLSKYYAAVAGPSCPRNSLRSRPAGWNSPSSASSATLPWSIAATAPGPCASSTIEAAWSRRTALSGPTSSSDTCCRGFTSRPQASTGGATGGRGTRTAGTITATSSSTPCTSTRTATASGTRPKARCASCRITSPCTLAG